MELKLPRILYICSLLACAPLLWGSPMTVVMAGCLSCLSLPLYNRLQRWGREHQRVLERNGPRRLLGLRLALARRAPVTAYLIILLACLLTPVATLALLVSPQAAAGFARLRELQANNFQLPPDWIATMQQWRARLADYPRIEKMLDEFLQNLATLFDDAMNLLFSRGVDFLGGTMAVLWTGFLFITLTVLFSVYARQIRTLAGRVCRIPQAVIGRFTAAIHRALRGILLGIVLVAMVQGLLCGLAFAVAGVRQPAFWGLLATLVAPIPTVGTALVWGPLCLSLWFTGKSVAAISLALWGVIVVAGVDSILRPLFLRQGIRAPFFVLILAILCGMASFGAGGLVLGPVLLALALQAVEEGNRYYREA